MASFPFLSKGRSSLNSFLYLLVAVAMSGVDTGSRSVLAAASSSKSSGLDEASDRMAPAPDAPAPAAPPVDADATPSAPDSAASSGGGSSPRAQEVMDYLTKHELTQKLNDAVNAVVKARADDPIGFMVHSLIPLTVYRCHQHQYDHSFDECRLRNSSSLRSR